MLSDIILTLSFDETTNKPENTTNCNFAHEWIFCDKRKLLTRNEQVAKI